MPLVRYKTVSFQQLRVLLTLSGARLGGGMFHADTGPVSLKCLILRGNYAVTLLRRKSEIRGPWEIIHVWVGPIA